MVYYEQLIIIFMEQTSLAPDFSPTGSELSGKQIKFGYWYASHKLLLRRLGILALAFFDLLIILLVFYGLIQYFFIGRGQVNALYQDLTSDKLNYGYLTELSEPQPLAINMVEVLRGSEGYYDLVAEINNPNNSWYVEELTYHFVANEFSGLSQTDFILPLQQKFVMNLHVPSAITISNPQLVIDNIKWKKVAFYENLRDKILNLEVVEPTFISENQIGGGELNINRVEAVIKNNSAYNFWDIKLKVLLYREDTLVYVNEVPIRILNSGNSYNMAFNIFNGVTRPNKIYIFPEIDILDPESFKGFE